MSNNNNNDLQRVSSKAAEMSIYSTNRPYYARVTQICDPDGYFVFGINSQRVDDLVTKLMVPIENHSADEVVTAFGIAFVLIARRFSFSIPSYLEFIENFLRADDIKLGCFGMQHMFKTYLKDTLTRYKKVNIPGRGAKLNFHHF